MRKLVVIAIGVVAVMSACGGGQTEPAKIDSTVVKNNYSALENFEPVVGGAEIKFNEEDFTFPPMEQGEEVVHSFYFVNTGDAPLVLTEVKGSCGCTGVEYPKEPILPGEKGRIDATIATESKRVDKVFSVRVYVNSNAITNRVVLNLKGVPFEAK